MEKVICEMHHIKKHYKDNDTNMYEYALFSPLYMGKRLIASVQDTALVKDYGQLFTDKYGIEIFNDGDFYTNDNGVIEAVYKNKRWHTS